jgi:hypothetical protein
MGTADAQGRRGRGCEGTRSCTIHATYEKVGRQLVDHDWTQHGTSELGREDRAPERFSVTPIQSVIRLDRRPLEKTINTLDIIIFYLETPLCNIETSNNITTRNHGT